MITNYSKMLRQPMSQHNAEPSGDPGLRDKKKTLWTGLALMIMLFVSNTFMAQSSANYVFETNTTGSLALDQAGNSVNMASGTTQLVGAGLDANASVVTNIGFDFYFMGNKFSQFSVQEDGVLQLGGTPVGTNVYTIAAGTLTSPRLAAFNADLRTGTTSGKIHYKLVGASPNRALIVEFTDMQLFYTGTAAEGSSTFQMRLYENGKIEYVYGPMSATNIATANRAASIGFYTGAAAGRFSSVAYATHTNATSGTYTANPNITATGEISALSSAANGSRRTYSFTPASVQSPTSLTFTAVGSSSQTVNWIDSSTNESSFLVSRATDINFTSNVVNNTVASTTTVATGGSYSWAQTGLFPSTLYYYRVQALAESISADLSGSNSTSASGNFTSVASGLWSDPATWSSGTVPNAGDIVTIATGTTVTQDATAAASFNLTVDGNLIYAATVANLAVANNLTINSSGSITGPTTGTVVTSGLNVGGNLLNNGVLDLSTNANTAGVVLTFSGAQPTNFTGTGTVNDLYSLSISKSALSVLVDVNVSNFTVRGLSTTATGSLLGSTGTGTLKFSGTNTFDGTLWNNAGFTIAGTFGFWLDNPNFTVNGLAGTTAVQGLFRVSAGTYNIGTVSGNSLTFNSNSTVIIEGGTVNSTSRFGVNAAANTVNFTQTGGTINVNSIGNVSTSLASFDLGTSTTSTVVLTGGSVNVILANTATSGPRDVRGFAGLLPLAAGTTFNFGTAASGAAKTFNFSGSIPSFVINNASANHSLSLSGAASTFANVTVPAGSTLNLNGNVYTNRGPLFTNNGTLTGTSSSSNLSFLSNVASGQTYAGSGTVTPGLTILTVNTGVGNLTLDPSITGINALRVNLITGTVVNSGKFTIGSGAALAASVFIGEAALATPGGNFDAAPIFNLGTGTFSVSYLQESVARTSGFEIPSTRTVNAMTVNNTNGVVLAGGPVDALTTLTLTAGNLTTTNANLLTLGSATASGTLTGGSATSYINGPIARTIANSNTAFITFPVGKSIYSPIFLSPATTSVAKMKAEAFDANSGTMDPSIVELNTSRRWEAPLVSGTATNVKVRIVDAGIVATNIVVQAPAAAGAYAADFGVTSTFTAATPNTLESTTAIPAANYTGFIGFATSNVCSGTPTPGTTLTTASTICLGNSITLSLQNGTVGTGVTYAWESSTDGVTYAPITGATAATYVATPSGAMFYRASVTCSGNTGVSSPVQITFSNSVVTTPGSRCGNGAVDLAATPSAGSIVNWYDSLTSGTSLGMGNTFTTPAITETTTFYAQSETPVTGVSTVGNGTSTSSDGYMPFNGGYGSLKGQYIFTAAELKSMGLRAGNITSLAFDFTTAGGPYNNFSLSLGNTALNEFSTPNIQGGLTEVFTTSSFAPTVGVNTMTFASPFNWDGTSNIIVSLCWHFSATATSGPTGTVRSNTVAGGLNMSQSYRKDAEASPCSFTGAVGSGISNLSASNNRPKTIFGGQVACKSAMVPAVATVTAPPALTLSATPPAFCQGQSSTPVTLTSTASDYDTYVWSPSTGVTGDAANGWVFNPSNTTNYTLTASQSTGSMCSTTASVTLTVNDLPTAITISPSPANVCTDTILPLIVTGGSVGVSGKIGSGVATNTVSTPFKGNWGGSKMQSLYTATELTELGIVPGQNIRSIGYVAVAGTPFVFNGFTISAGFVNATTLGTSFINGANTVVYAPAAYTPSTGVGNLDFALATPLLWDGTSSLLIETCFNNNTTGNGAASVISVESSTVASGLQLYRSQDSNVNFCSNATTPTAVTNRPNLRVSTIENVNFAWSPTTNLYTDAAATVPYVVSSNATTVYFKSNSAAPAATYTATATSLQSCPTTASVVVTVTASVVPNFAAIPAFCSGETAPVLDTTSPNGVVGTWSPAVVSNTANGTYVFTPNEGQCASTQTLDVVVNTTAAPTGTSPQDFATAATLADFDVTGAAIVWYDAETAGNVLPETTLLVSGVTYYASQTLNGCESPIRLAVTAGTNLKVDGFDFNSLKYYPNPVNNVLTVSYSQEITGLKLYNMVGQQLIAKKVNTTETQLDMSHLPAGSYLLEVSSGSKSKMVKLLKNQ